MNKPKTRILIFGAGDLGNRYLYSLRNSEKGKEAVVVGFLDNNVKGIVGVDWDMTGGIPCFRPEKVIEHEYDLIVIASGDVNMRAQMQTQLLGLGVRPDKIQCFTDPKYVAVFDYEKRFEFFKSFAGFAERQGIKGNTAECGVCTGYTAAMINLLYPKRKVYLFDTFEGFPQEDIDAERALGDSRFMDCGFNRVGCFQAAIDEVMGRMKYPENVVVKKGRIPETFSGVDDTFCFVHLDMDLYQPMLAALKFFWDRMSPGGIMVCHDYFYTSCLPGVEKAVADFEAWLGKTVTKLPVSHYTVGLVLVKN